MIGSFYSSRGSRESDETKFTPRNVNKPLICFADFQVEFARRDAGRRVEEDDGDVQVRGDGRQALVSRADQKGQDGGGG